MRTRLKLTDNDGHHFPSSWFQRDMQLPKIGGAERPVLPLTLPPSVRTPVNTCTVQGEFCRGSSLSFYIYFCYKLSKLNDKYAKSLKSLLHFYMNIYILYIGKTVQAFFCFLKKRKRTEKKSKFITRQICEKPQHNTREVVDR